MENTAIVITDVHCGRLGFNDEVTKAIGVYVCTNGDELITVFPIVFMVETKGVAYLMYNCPQLNK